MYLTYIFDSFIVHVYFCSRLSDLATLYEGGSIKENGLTEVDGVTAEAYERRIQKMERENKELSRKLQGQLVHITFGFRCFVTSESNREIILVLAGFYNSFVNSISDATKTIQSRYGMAQYEAPGSPAPGLEAEVRRLREENANLKEKVSGMIRNLCIEK